MTSQEFADGTLGDADEDAVEHLQDISEGRAMALVGRDEKMRRLVEDEEAIEAAVLDKDAVAGDIGQAADFRIVEAGDEFETRDLPIERAKHSGNQCPGRVDAEDAMSFGKTRE